jgi:hypothetical protein
MLSFGVKGSEYYVGHSPPSSFEIMEYANLPPWFGEKKYHILPYPSSIFKICEAFTMTALWAGVAMV